MTAVLGTTYPGGLAIASESFRTGGGVELAAQKIFRGPSFLLSAAGTTYFMSPAMGEILHLHKFLVTAIHQEGSTTGKIEESNITKYVDDYFRLLTHLSPDCAAEVLIGFRGSSQLLYIDGKAGGTTWVSKSNYSALGATRGYMDFLTRPEVMSSTLQERLRTLPNPPPIQEQCSSKDEAEQWLKDVIQWCCLAFPHTCRGTIQIEHI